MLSIFTQIFYLSRGRPTTNLVLFVKDLTDFYKGAGIMV